MLCILGSSMAIGNIGNNVKPVMFCVRLGGIK